MCFFFSFIPATFWVTVGYFVLFSSMKAEEPVRKFGKILAIWIFVLALLFPICGAYMALSGDCPFDQVMNLIKAAGAN